MLRQRYSCDRCRQQKVRCLKNWELSAAVSRYDDHVTPCERCTKADVPCVYSFKQRNRQSRGQNTDIPSPTGNTRLSQDLSSVFSNADVTPYGLNDLIIPSLDRTMAGIDNSDAYSWNDSPALMYTRDGDNRAQESSGSNSLGSNPKSSQNEGERETLAEQLMKLSNRATGATRELECAIITSPLTVNSTVVNVAFEAANTLVHIINNIARAESTSNSSQRLSCDGGERRAPAVDSSIFLALACHQHVLALFHAVCNCIKRSLGPEAQGDKPQLQQQALHGVGSSPAQFIMVLQLIMHLLNRLGRSLQIASPKSTNQHDLAFGPDGTGENGCSESILDSAQVMLRSLPDEQAKLVEAIQELQAYIEEEGYV